MITDVLVLSLPGWALSYTLDGHFTAPTSRETLGCLLLVLGATLWSSSSPADWWKRNSTITCVSVCGGCICSCAPVNHRIKDCESDYNWHGLRQILKLFLNDDPYGRNLYCKCSLSPYLKCAVCLCLIFLTRSFKLFNNIHNFSSKGSYQYLLKI